MIIASIAMEELALSHILNAEGEKLQYILGTLPGTKPCAGPNEVLSINKSVTGLVEAVTQNQMLLKNKLERVLEVCPNLCPPPCRPEPGPHPGPPPCRPEPGPHPGPPPCRPEPGPHPGPRPCPPSCNQSPCTKSLLQLEGQRADLVWKQGVHLPWRQLIRRGTELRWNERNPGKIWLNPGKAYMVQYTLNICTTHPTEERGCIRLVQNSRGAFLELLPFYFKMECCEDQTQTLQNIAVLYPSMGHRNEVELTLILQSPETLHVRQAIMNIVEL